jgi:hypothetical protein
MPSSFPEITSLTSFPSLLPASVEPLASQPAAVWLPVSAQPSGQPVIAQYFDQDLFGSSSKIFSHFIESGQVWALLVGLVLGYLLRGLTSY